MAFKVVLPIMVYVTIGYILRLLKFFDEKSLKTVNNLVFKVFLPCLLFYNIYTTQIDKILDFDLIVYAVCFVSILFLLLMIFVPVFVKDNSKRGVIIQGIFRSNFVLFGMPVTISLMGEGNGGLTSIAIAFIVPLYNVLAVICLETFRKNKINIFTVLKGIVKNPLIISSVLGILFLSFEIKLPVVLSDIVRDLSRVATPLALVGLGASFTFRSVKNNLGYLSAIVLMKLIVLPVTAISISAYVFGFRGAAIVTLISVFASPTAVSSFTMAQSMGGDSDLAAQTVVFTSVFSIITVFAVVAVTKFLGLY